jgi:hypothetical protein
MLPEPPLAAPEGSPPEPRRPARWADRATAVLLLGAAAAVVVPLVPAVLPCVRRRGRPRELHALPGPLHLERRDELVGMDRRVNAARQHVPQALGERRMPRPPGLLHALDPTEEHRVRLRQRREGRVGRRARAGQRVRCGARPPGGDEHAYRGAPQAPRRPCLPRERTRSSRGFGGAARRRDPRTRSPDPRRDRAEPPSVDPIGPGHQRHPRLLRARG